MTATHGNLAEMELERDPFAPVPPPGQDDLPSEDGVPMETVRHRVQMSLLVDTLNDHWADRDDVFVGGNMFVYYSELQTRQNDFRGPDVFVVLDTDASRRRKSWVVWEEGGRLPEVVIELLSDSTREIDRKLKYGIYERIWRVGTYVLYDPHSHELIGFRRAGSRFEPIVPDARGDLRVEELGLSLGLRGPPQGREPAPFLRWIDGERTLPTGAERADTERERADTERHRADAERQRADAERERADAERERAERAERRLAELEARLSGGGT